MEEELAAGKQKNLQSIQEEVANRRSEEYRKLEEELSDIRRNRQKNIEESLKNLRDERRQEADKAVLTQRRQKIDEIDANLEKKRNSDVASLDSVARDERISQLEKDLQNSFVFVVRNAINNKTIEQERSDDSLEADRAPRRSVALFSLPSNGDSKTREQETGDSEQFLPFMSFPGFRSKNLN